MKRLCLLASMLVGALGACDRTDAEVLSPTEVGQDTTPRVVVVDTTPKDTVVVVLPPAFPPVDSMVLAFVPVDAPRDTSRWRFRRSDSLFRVPLDTGTGKVWLLAAQGRKNGRPWWSLDSVRVKPDSARRIVLDSAWRRLVVADTSTPVIVPFDTSLYVLASALSGDALPRAGQERGLFFRYDSGRLELRLVSDGDVAGSAYNRVFNANVSLGFSAGGAIGAVLLEDPYVSSHFDNDSVSTLQVTSRTGGATAGVSTRIFANYWLKTLSIPVAKCTVDVAVALRSGVIPVGVPNWVMPSISDDLAKDFLFLGQGRNHPTKTHFKIVIP